MTTEQIEAMLAVQETYRKMQEEQVEVLDEKSEQSKMNKVQKNMMDASKGAKHNVSSTAPLTKEVTGHKTTQQMNKAIGRHLRKEEVEELDEGGMGLGSAYGYGERRAEIGRDERQPRYKSTAKPAANKIFHKVPFAKKDEAKAEGMRFDGTSKKWYHSDAAKSKTSKFVKEDVDLDESERAEKKKSLVSMLDRMAKKAAENTKLQKNRAIKKPVFKEEVEELDELSKKTLGSYVKKAADSVQANTRQANTGDDYDLKHKSLLKTNKRISGIGSAVRKLTKEEVELDESVNHTTFIKKYKENEDDNKHSENVVHLAKHFGSDEDKKEARSILTTHNKVGNLTPEVKKRRDALHKKLWSPVIDRAYSKKSVDESVDLDEKELTPTDVKQKEKVVKGMKKNLQSFKDKYGEKAKGVMYATATKLAQKMPDVKEEVELEEAVKSDNEAGGYHNASGSSDSKYSATHTKVKKIAGEAGHLRDVKKPNEMVKHYLDSARGKHLIGNEHDKEYVSKDFKGFKDKYEPSMFNK